MNVKNMLTINYKISKPTREARSEVKHVEGAEKQFICRTKHKQNRSHVVEPHDRVGSEVGNLVRCLSMLQRGVHLYPVTGYVQSYQQLEQEEVGGVEIAQHHYETRGRTPDAEAIFTNIPQVRIRIYTHTRKSTSYLS